MMFRLVLLFLAATRVLAAQAPQAGHRGGDRLKYVAGAGMAFLSHESGHLALDLLFLARPHLSPVRFGPIPFFAVAHRRSLAAGQEFATTAAGFWFQAAASEWILSRHPRLREEHRPMLKGVLAFNILMPAAYALAGASGVGPPERDPRGMAVASGVSEPVVSMFVLVPAVLDGYRYLHPGKRWPIWVSRAVKVGCVALALRAATK